jgi:archaemetzincin
MEQPNITLVAFGYFGKEMLDELVQSVHHEFDCPVKVNESRTDLSLFYHPARRQYNADLLLAEVERISRPDPEKTIGLFHVDLFIPILTYIFGQARLGGKSGVASLYRLQNELYGLPPSPVLLTDRFCKEVIHETGHTFGLLHCQSPECVMRASTYPEEIDMKGMRLCHNCKASLH